MNAPMKSSLFLWIVCGSANAFLLSCSNGIGGGRRGPAAASGNSMVAGPSGSQLWSRTARTDPSSGLGAEGSDAPQSVSSAAAKVSTRRQASSAATADDTDEDEDDDDDELLSCAIDSLLRGDYPFEYAEDAPAPHPGLGPGAVVGSVLRSLRKLDDPHPSHGAAVLWRFCLPLTRSERWGGASASAITGGGGSGSASSRSRSNDPFKDLLRTSLTPALLARQLRASSEFSCLLDWKHLDVTEGAYGLQRDWVGAPSVAYVNAALYFEEGMEPVLIQFTLRRIGGVWLLDSARRSPKELFADR